MSGERLREFEKMRGIAILAVVIIHVTAGATIAFSPEGYSYFLYNIVNSLLQFAVPVFLFISSVVLAWKLSNEEISLSKFYGKRMQGVLIPYLLWSFLYIAFKYLTSGGRMNLSGSFIVQELLNGTAYYHLYFLLIIVQLYFFLPLILPMLGRMKFSQVFILTFLLQVLFYYLNRNWFYQFYPYPANLLGSYLSVFMIGCWFGLNYQKGKAFLQKYQGYFWMLHLVLTTIFVIINIRLRMGLNVGLVTYYGSYHFFVLASAVSIWLFSLQGQSFILQKIGDYSFSIYLVHPFFLAIWHYLWLALGVGSTSHFFYLVGFLFTLVFSYAASYVFAKWRILGRIFLGR